MACCRCKSGDTKKSCAVGGNSSCTCLHQSRPSAARHAMQLAPPLGRSRKSSRRSSWNAVSCSQGKSRSRESTTCVSCLLANEPCGRQRSQNRPRMRMSRLEVRWLARRSLESVAHRHNRLVSLRSARMQAAGMARARPSSCRRRCTSCRQHPCHAPLWRAIRKSVTRACQVELASMREVHTKAGGEASKQARQEPRPGLRTRAPKPPEPWEGPGHHDMHMCMCMCM